jgi:DNA-binding transcriptional ArsR family regulator
VAAKRKKRKGESQTLAQAVAHPLRIEALSILTERPASPKELAAELGSPVGNISYHVRELERIGMIELVEEKKRRGAIEHFYRAVHYPMVDAPEWEKLSPARREAMSVWIVQLMLTDAVKALDAGTFDARGDRHLTRTDMLVDEKGWEELIEIQAKALRAVLAVRERNAKRLAKADGEGAISVVASMSCFELPGPPPGSARQPPRR